MLPHKEEGIKVQRRTAKLCGNSHHSWYQCGAAAYNHCNPCFTATETSEGMLLKRYFPGSEYPQKCGHAYHFHAGNDMRKSKKMSQGSGDQTADGRQAEEGRRVDAHDTATPGVISQVLQRRIDGRHQANHGVTHQHEQQSGKKK